jgi:hypothetical protein
MAEPPATNVPTLQQLRAGLHELAEVLHEKHRLEPQAQEALANLMDELSKALDPTAAPPAETAQLAASAAQLAKTLHQKHNQTLLAAAKQRLEEAAFRAETAAPLATGLARRLLDVLADLGI